MDSPIETLTRIRQIHDEIRERVGRGDLDSLDRLLGERGTLIEDLRCALRRSPDLEHQLEGSLAALRREDGELLEWMRKKKEEIAGAISSLQLEGNDPYQQKFVGSALLDQRT